MNRTKQHKQVQLFETQGLIVAFWNDGGQLLFADVTELSYTFTDERDISRGPHENYQMCEFTINAKNVLEQNHEDGDVTEDDLCPETFLENVFKHLKKNDIFNFHFAIDFDTRAKKEFGKDFNGTTHLFDKSFQDFDYAMFLQDFTLHTYKEFIKDCIDN